MPESLKDLMRTLPQVGRVGPAPVGSPRSPRWRRWARGWWGTATGGARCARVGRSPSSSEHLPAIAALAGHASVRAEAGETSWSLGSAGCPQGPPLPRRRRRPGVHRLLRPLPPDGGAARARGLQRHAGDGRICARVLQGGAFGVGDPVVALSDDAAG